MTVPLDSSGVLGWGWLQGTVRSGAPRVRALLTGYLGEAFDQEYGTRWYDRAAKVGTRGSLIAWNPRGAGEERGLEVFFQIVQSDCDALGIDQVAKLARELLALGAHFTRADAYYDDRRRRSDPRVVLAAFRARRCVTHLRKSSLVDDGEDGVTAYLGQRGQSEVFIRSYDKDAEMRLKHPEQLPPPGGYGIRWEIQARDDRAGWLVGQVLLAEGERGPAMAAVLVALCDFRDRDGEVHGERSPRLTWWAALVGDVERARRDVARVIDSLARRAAWVRRQVAPTLGLLLLDAGGDVGWLVGVARGGARRLTRPQLALLAEGDGPTWVGEMV